MPLKDFQNSMIQISGDIHGQVNNSVFSDIEISQASTINQFNRNRSNARVWFDVKDFTSTQKASVKSIGSSSNGIGLEIGKTGRVMTIPLLEHHYYLVNKIYFLSPEQRKSHQQHQISFFQRRQKNMK